MATTGMATVACRLDGYRGSAEATVEVRHLGRRTRAARALAGLGACWGIGLLSAFIPVAHLLLVPGFAVAGIVLFVRRLRTDALASPPRATCPDCGAEQTLELPSRWQPPHRVTCSGCGRGLVLRHAGETP